MIIVRNRIIPFQGYKCINILGILFVRSNVRFLNINTVTHERIHTKQMVEMLFIGFYLWYLFEWIFKLFKYKDSWLAYKSISFEQEAYMNEGDIGYPMNREHFAWLKYIGNSN